jgi:hypothetical protein
MSVHFFLGILASIRRSRLKVIVLQSLLPESYDTPSSLEIMHRIDSPLPQNVKPLLNKDLPQAGNGDYKPAYKQYRKVTPNETQEPPFDLAEIATLFVRNA